MLNITKLSYLKNGTRLSLLQSLSKKKRNIQRATKLLRH